MQIFCWTVICVLSIVPYVLSLELEMDTIWSLKSGSTYDRLHTRDIINLVDEGMTQAIKVGWSRQNRGKVSAFAKAKPGLTESQREYCFAFIFRYMMDNCLATIEGKRTLCKYYTNSCGFWYDTKHISTDLFADQL